MTQRTRMAIGTLVLALIAGGVGAYAFFGVYKPKKRTAAAKLAASRLLPSKLAPVRGMTVTKGSGPTVVLRREKGGWEIVKPVKVKADDATVKTIVDRLLEADTKKTVVPAAGAEKVLAKYGLAHPSLLITLDAGTHHYRIRMGMENAFDNEVYVRSGDGPIGLVSAATKLPLSKSLFDLREKRVLRFVEPSVEALTVTLPDQHYTFTRVKGERWKVSGLVDDRADPASVHEVIAALTGMRAVAFPKGDPKTFGLDHPEITVSVDLEGKGHATLKLASKKVDGVARWYAVGSQVQGVAQVPADTESRLEKTRFSLRYKTVVHFDRGRAAKLVVTAPGGGFTAQRTSKAGKDGGFTASETWAVTAPTPEPAKHWKIASALYELMDLKATGFAVEKATHADLAAHGLAPAAQSWTVLDATGKVLGVLHLGHRAGGDKGVWYATNGDPGRIYEIANQVVRSLPKRAADVAAAGSGTPKG